ncbi:hypothetical protein HBH98_106820 [Parastagonospora nodorum]|nr:hypothetical protein HBH43_166730 [Parastagonospora nodorum]KAH4346581.1 hypothetical protein HBH98_106820 [Parastagonospora nodorum]KAH4385685.1 hypothetical protein HBH97_064710 [Parastagonospora nodorum]KAH4399579.1 hypothetical protein HBH99_096080 [Parastagonospora nodorum]KAH5057906.1 hypothetical protein HBH96_099510 [Parastagonospora nodorum]
MASRANPMGLGGAGARQSRGRQSMPPPHMAGGPAPPRSSHRPASNVAPRVASHHPSRQASHHPSREQAPASYHPSRTPTSHHPSRNLAPPTLSQGMLPPRSSRAPASSHRAPQPSYHSSRQQHPPLDFGRSGPPPIPYDQRPSQIALANGQSRGPRAVSGAQHAFAPGDYTKVGQGQRASLHGLSQVRQSQAYQSQGHASQVRQSQYQQSQGQPRQSQQYQQSQSHGGFRPSGVEQYDNGGISVEQVEDFVLHYPSGPIPGRSMPSRRGASPNEQEPLIGGQEGASLVRRMYNHPNELVWLAFVMMFQQQGGCS